MSEPLTAADTRADDAGHGDDGAAAGEWRRTDPLGLVVHLLTGLQKAILPSIAVIVGGREWGGATAILIAILVVLLVSGIASWLAWRHHRYRIGSDDIRVERGLIRRTARSVPYERIQDVSIEEALIPRLLGLVEVRFETGAGGSEEVKLTYVSREEGEALRQTVRVRKVEARKGDEATAAPSPAPREPATRTLFAMDLRRLLTFGLFEFSLVFFALLAGVMDQFGMFLPFDIPDLEEWREGAGIPIHLLQGLGLAAQAVTVILGLMAVGAVGLATGILRTVLRDYGFRLEETARGLRRRRGLLTRSDVTMPVERVQALRVRTGIVRRRFGPPRGWHSLALVSLANDASSGRQTVVPFGSMEEIGWVAEVTGFHLPGPEVAWHLPSARYHLDRAMTGVLPLGLVAGWVAMNGALLSATGIAAVATLPALCQFFLWRNNRHALSGGQIFVRHGWLAPELDVGSRVKLQSAEIVQGPLARRRGYANLVFGVAGGTLAIKGMPVPEARALRDEVVESMAATDFSKLPGGSGVPTATGSGAIQGMRAEDGAGSAPARDAQGGGR